MRTGSEMNFLRHVNRFVAKGFTRYPWLFHRWARRSRFLQFSDSPWTPLNRPVQESRLALVTTGGVHLKTDRPFDMKAPAGDPSFREIPAGAVASELAITHDYFDHKDADRDINILLPIDRVQDLKRSGEIGAVNGRHFSFMGHVQSRCLDTLINTTAREVAQSLKADGVHIVILTPA
jgi:D-proline reductase (dithiol) PrdB